MPSLLTRLHALRVARLCPCGAAGLCHDLDMRKRRSDVLTLGGILIMVSVQQVDLRQLEQRVQP